MSDEDIPVSVVAAAAAAEITSTEVDSTAADDAPVENNLHTIEEQSKSEGTKCLFYIFFGLLSIIQQL